MKKNEDKKENVQGVTVEVPDVPVKTKKSKKGFVIIASVMVVLIAAALVVPGLIAPKAELPVGEPESVEESKPESVAEPVKEKEVPSDPVKMPEDTTEGKVAPKSVDKEEKPVEEEPVKETGEKTETTQPVSDPKKTDNNPTTTQEQKPAQQPAEQPKQPAQQPVEQPQQPAQTPTQQEDAPVEIVEKTPEAEQPLQHYHGNGTDGGMCPVCGTHYSPLGHEVITNEAHDLTDIFS